MNSWGGTTKISVVMGVFKKADDTSQDVSEGCCIQEEVVGSEKMVLQHMFRRWRWKPPG